MRLSREWYNPVVAERIEVGKEVGGYAVTGRIGEGGMGAVYLAEDRESGKRFALKVLLAAQGDNEEFKRRFERESRYASSLIRVFLTPSRRMRSWSALPRSTSIR